MASVLDKPKPRTDESERRNSTLHIRITQKSHDLFERAAKASGKTMTDFVIDAVTPHAIDILLDQRLFVLDSDKFDAFMRALDEPPSPDPKLNALMKRRSAWEK